MSLKKCRCINPEYRNFDKKYYDYKIESKSLYSYIILDEGFRVATFSKEYFDKIFIDLNEERRQKLENLNS